MSQRSTITEELKTELIRLNTLGYTFREMAEKVGKNQSTVAGWFNRGYIPAVKFDARPKRSGHHR